MTTLHLQTETGYQTASAIKQNAAQALEEAQALQRAIQNLSSTWRGGAQAEFMYEANVVIRQLQNQIMLLQTLSERLQREISEWEEVDQRGASSLRGLGVISIFNSGVALPFAGGLGNSPFYNRAILPLFTALSVMPFLGNLPTWLNSFLDRFFQKPEIPSPITDGSTPTSRLGELLKETPQTTAPTQVAPSPADGYDIYYDIPPKSQGILYGSAACLPTSFSMVLDHYHSQNPANQTASPEDLLGMLDQGDGTVGSGVGLDRMNDDLAELGYQSTVRPGSMDDLNAALKEGPVVVNTKVGLLSSPARDIQPGGATNHAVLVKAINADTVVVNDPWSGAEKSIPRETFERMWTGGGNYMITVRPDGSAQ